MEEIRNKIKKDKRTNRLIDSAITVALGVISLPAANFYYFRKDKNNFDSIILNGVALYFSIVGTVLSDNSLKTQSYESPTINIEHQQSLTKAKDQSKLKHDLFQGTLGVCSNLAIYKNLFQEKYLVTNTTIYTHNQNEQIECNYINDTHLSSQNLEYDDLNNMIIKSDGKIISDDLKKENYGGLCKVAFNKEFTMKN